MFPIPAVTLYSKPACVQCTAAERRLKKDGVEYVKLNLPDLPEKLAEFKAAGHLQAPVIEAEGVETFHGFDVEKLAEVAKLHGK